MKILLAGDTHGNTLWVINYLCWKYSRGHDKLFILGDFGYWEHTAEGKKYLDKLDRKGGIPIYFLDGNHENHPMLWEKYTDKDDEGFIIVRDRIRYAPRGHSWEWNGTKFLALGGAASIDKDWRLEREKKKRKPLSCWWPTEYITDEQKDLAKSKGKIDIMLTHDVPKEIPVPGLRDSGKDFHLPSYMTREKLDEVMKHCRPDYLFHGHHHVFHQFERVFAFDNDGHMDWHKTIITGLQNEFGPAKCSTFSLELK